LEGVTHFQFSTGDLKENTHSPLVDNFSQKNRITHLSFLWLEENSTFFQDHLESLKHVTAVRFISSYISPNAADGFKHMEKLTHLSFSLHNTDEGNKAVASLVGLKTVTDVRFVDNGDTVSPELVQALCQNRNVQSVTFMRHNFSDDDGLYVCTNLFENPSITSICFANNRVGDRFAKELAPRLLENKTVKHLNLINNNFSEEGKESLRRAVRDRQIDLKL